jgi:hypothetical protein
LPKGIECPILHSAEGFLEDAGVALLQENSEEWLSRMAFEGVTVPTTIQLFTFWRAYLLRQQLGDRFGQLVNVMGAVERPSSCCNPRVWIFRGCHSTREVQDGPVS